MSNFEQANQSFLVNSRVATSWKSSEFFCCPGKSLNFVDKSWKVLENICEVSRSYRDRIVKLISLSTKHLEHESPVKIALNTMA